MKNLFLSIVLLLTVSFAFATNDVEKTELINSPQGTCWVQITVTATNSETGESYSYNYWQYVGTASSKEECTANANALVASMQAEQ